MIFKLYLSIVFANRNIEKMPLRFLKNITISNVPLLIRQDPLAVACSYKGRFQLVEGLFETSIDFETLS
jgi:hypothetical protein